jgi:hypothetical protein
MMQAPTVTDAQRDVLRAAGRNEISRGAGPNALDYGWREGGEFGRSVTNTVEALMRRGLVCEGARVVDERRALVVTAAGYEALSKAHAKSKASR